MNISFKQLMEERLEKRARELAWRALNSKDKRALLNEAKRQLQAEDKDLALDIIEKVNKNMSDPDYVSRIDSDIYIK